MRVIQQRASVAALIPAGPRKAQITPMCTKGAQRTGIHQWGSWRLKECGFILEFQKDVPIAASTWLLYSHQFCQ